ncbi:hypothetical protein B0H14DRAFT_2605584 [Mycena olivaceomarginata]|nr:hypothetical protein B0H14DRAFT_2605584 [Mycena olivaceomarginata]
MPVFQSAMTDPALPAIYRLISIFSSGTPALDDMNQLFVVWTRKIASLTHYKFEHMPPTNSQAGVPLPLPDAFDYVSWMTPPPDADIPVLMDVKVHNKRNIVIDTFNNTSIDITCAYMEAARDGTLAAGQDIYRGRA